MSGIDTPRALGRVTSAHGIDVEVEGLALPLGGTAFVRRSDGTFVEGEVVGQHTVTFENEGEKVEFTHSAQTRDAFAMGALRAAQWVVTRKPGIYDMQDVLEL